jgi:hypothetical protein
MMCFGCEARLWHRVYLQWKTIPSSRAYLPRYINLGQLQNAYNEWLKALHDKEQFESPELPHPKDKLICKHSWLSAISWRCKSRASSVTLPRYINSQGENYLERFCSCRTAIISLLWTMSAPTRTISHVALHLEDYQEPAHSTLKMQKNDIRCNACLETSNGLHPKTIGTPHAGAKHFREPEEPVASMGKEVMLSWPR